MRLDAVAGERNKEREKQRIGMRDAVMRYPMHRLHA